MGMSDRDIEHAAAMIRVNAGPGPIALASAAPLPEERRHTQPLPPAKQGEHLTVYIPPELVQESLRIKRFIDAMLWKLRCNAHKGGMEIITVLDALKHLRGEVEELAKAIEEGNSTEILLEAADVANFGLITSVAAVERGK